jgi:hypothetical protein
MVLFVFKRFHNIFADGEGVVGHDGEGGGSFAGAQEARRKTKEERR